MSKTVYLLLAALLLVVLQGCTQHKVEIAPVEIKPIHITIDVNVKIDKALDDFFGDVDDAEQKIDKTSSATQ
jgi:Skp family chaperone for outer membrane proteins